MLGVSRLNTIPIYTYVVLTTIVSAVTLITAYSYLLDYLGPLASLLITVFLFVLVYLALSQLMINKIKHDKKILQNVLNSMTDVVFIKDTDGNFSYCNNAIASLYDTKPELMLGKSDYDFTHDLKSSEEFITNAKLIMEKMQTEEVYESAFNMKTGKQHHFQSIKIPYLDTENNKKLLVVAKDITEIINLKQESERNRARLEHVLDVSEEGLWEWNTQTNQVLHNARWEEITGVHRSKNSFSEFEQCILPEDRNKVMQVIQELLEHNRPYNIEFRMQRPDGKIIWVWDRGKVSEYDADGNPIWLAGLILDITEEKANQEKVHSLAYYDQLTGLYNRSQLEEKLSETIAISKVNNTYCALLFIDLDRFKLMNDSYGHHMGDKLLKIIAKRLSHCHSESNIIARFGGDEFVIILPLHDADKASALSRTQAFADLVLEKIASTLHLKSDVKNLDIEYAITASIGGVVFRADQVPEEKLLQLADMALYRAKGNGRQIALIFDASNQQELAQKTDLQKSMLNTDVEKEFIIHLQGKYDQNHHLVGAEALVRWQHPELGLLVPITFIKMAEESNMILPIGEFVLSQACQTLQKWQSNPATAHLTLSINLSAKQIWQSQFVEEFINIINHYDIDHTKLMIEITESILLQDITDATEKLTRLKAFGIAISLDDFGIGLSSFNHLRTLPIDEIKIDNSLISELVENEQSQQTVKAIVDLANNFDLKIVSEGVENATQFEMLKAYQIPYFQGCLFSQPLKQTEFNQLLEKDLKS